MQEIWKDIKGFEGRYQVSNLGNVKSLHSNSKRPTIQLMNHINHKGYARVHLTKKRL